MPKLCINIDHIATLRQTRLDNFSLEKAIVSVKKAQASGVTVHLREDRRHIQDWDLPLVRKKTKDLGLLFTLEIAPIEEMVSIAQRFQPDLVTLVPEKREELTTEGGLALLENKKKYKKIIDQLKHSSLLVSLFINPEPETIEVASTLVDSIELHTGRFSEIFKNSRSSSLGSDKTKSNKKLELELENLKRGARFARELGLKVNAGHGIDKNNLPRILEIQEIRELHIGYSVVCEAIFVGLENSVKDFLQIIRKS